MNPIRVLTSWLGRPTVKHRRGLLVERLEDRLTPTVSDKLLAVPVDLSTLPTTQDLIALTPSTVPLNDLANLVSHFGLGNIIDLAGSGVVTQNGSSSLVQIHLQAGANARTAATTLFSTGLYSFVSPNYIYPPGLSGRDLTEAVPNDPQYGSQYHSAIIDAPTAWDTTLGNSTVVVAILDDGLDINHPDLIQNIWTNGSDIAGDGIDNDGNGFIDDAHGWNFVGNNSNVLPDNSLLDQHSTQIAGILSGRIDNGLGVAGIAGRAGIMPLKVIGNGPTTSLSLVRAINYAVANGAKIINSSINIDPFVSDPAFLSAVSSAYDKGVLWVNSAGNLNLQDPERAKLSNMLIVGATDRTDHKTSYSNYGWGIDISTPGGSDGDPLITTLPGGLYGNAWGSSLAAPLVAGTAALLWSANPTWTRDQVVSAILANADDLDVANPNFLDLLGTGRLDAGEAVSGGPFVTGLGRVYGLPDQGQDATAAFDSFRIRLMGNLDAGTVISGNFELRWAGLDNMFDSGDDHVVPLNVADGYQYATNSLDLRFSETLGRGFYRFTAISGGLRDPFGTAVDGDDNGTAGGNLVRYFGNPILVSGHIGEDLNGDGMPTPGDPGVPGAILFPDLNGNGQLDQTTFPTTGAPVAIPDDPNSSASVGIPVSGFTRPVNYLAVTVTLDHPAPADLVIALISPSGQRVVLFRNRPVPGGPTAATQIFNFADDIVEGTTVTQSLITRNLKPDQALSSLYGNGANGTWTVEVVDTTPGDSGTLISAAITIGEEARIIPNADGGFTVIDLPIGPVTIRVLPPIGWEVSGPDKNPAIVVDTSRELPGIINISLVRSAGISGRVIDAGQAVGGFTVFIDADGDGTLDGGELQTVSGEDGRYAFEGLPTGSYTLRILPSPGYSLQTSVQSATLTAAAPLATGKDFSVLRDTAPVEVTLPAVSPVVRTTPVIAIDFSLSEPVNDLRLTDLKLARDGVNVPLISATLIGSGTTYTLIGLDELTTIDGYYTLTISAPAPAGQPDREPEPAVTTWTLDTTPPTATLVPTAGPKGIVDIVTILFSTPVNGLDITDFTLRRNGVAISTAALRLEATGFPHQFLLNNLASAGTTPGNYTLELHDASVIDIAGNPLAGPIPINWTVPQQPVHFTAIGAGEGSRPTVFVYDTAGNVVRTLTPYDTHYTGGVRVATGDINGDLYDDIIVAPGRGAGPHVRIYDGKTGLVIREFFAFESNFRGGVYVTSGDLTGDGRAEIVVSPDTGGGPRIRVLDGMDLHTVADFFGIDDANFRGGARAAIGDITGDGRADLVVSAGTGGGPRIALFDGISVAANRPAKLVGDFLAFDASLRNGAYLALADLNNDGRAEIIASAGDGGGPRVSAFSGADILNGQLRRVSDFFVGDIASRGGLRVAVKHGANDSQELFVAPGQGVYPTIRVFNAVTLMNPNPGTIREFDPFDGFLGGIYLG